jgi:hypothetical protein
MVNGRKAFHVERLVLQGGRYRGACLRENRGLIDVSFTSSPADFMYGNGLEVLKDVCPVRVVRCGDVCLKYYMSRGAKDVLKRWCGMSKGKRSFQWALALLFHLIPTPEPVCYLDGQGGDSFYLSRFVDSAGHLAGYLQGVSPEEQRRCLEVLSHFLNRMFCRGVYHLDLKGTNVLVNNVGSIFQFYLTDTDEVAVYRKGMYKPLYKSLVRITRTLVPYFSREELIAFAVRCLYNSPVTMHPQDVVDRAFKIATMKQSH